MKAIQALLSACLIENIRALKHDYSKKEGVVNIIENKKILLDLQVKQKSVDVLKSN